MRNLILIIISLSINLSEALAQQPIIDWVISDTSLVDITVDSKDNIIALRKDEKGYSITRYNGNGSQIWSIQDTFNINSFKGIKVDQHNNILIFGTEKRYHHTDTLFAQGNLYLFEYYLTSFCIAKYDSAGAILFQTKYEPAISRSGINVKTIEIDIENNIYMCAAVGDTAKLDTISIINPGFDPWDFPTRSYNFVAKISEDGNVFWVKEYATDVNIRDICLDNNSFYIIGSFYYATLQIDSLIILNSYGNNDAFIAKYNYEGAAIWAKNFGSMWNDKPYSISSSNNNDILFSFRMQDTIGIYNNGTIISNGVNCMHNYSKYLFKTDSIGDLIWYKPFIQESSYSDVEISPSNNTDLINLSFYEYVKFDSLIVNSVGENDACIIKINEFGDVIWYKHIGGNNNDRILRVFSDLQNDIYIFGSYETSITLDDTTLTSINSGKFICKLLNDSLNYNIIIPVKYKSEFFQIYPNPIVDYFYIDSQNYFTITIYDLTGKVIRNSTSHSAGKQHIGISDFQKGVYFIKVETGNYFEIRRLVKL